MVLFVLTVAYDGAPFCGWQSSGALPSVEGELRRVLTQILNHPVELQAASRTDRGVHAEGQVVSFETSSLLSADKLKQGLNGLLPKSIVVLEVRELSHPFHPTLDARSKVYTYRLSLGPLQMPLERFKAWHIHEPLDLEAMHLAASFFLGTHDFSAFCNQRKDLRYPDKYRTLQRIELRQKGDLLEIELQADRFLYKMARNLVGTLVDIGRKKYTPASVLEMLQSKARSRAGVTAPAHGLTLKKVYYDRTQ